jgi:hypothetical protein
MRQPRQDSRHRQPRLPFPPTADQPSLWTSLPHEQRHACQELLGQLLHEVLCHERDECEPNPRSASHE